MKNNFDMSSTGVNITSDIYFSNDNNEMVDNMIKIGDGKYIYNPNMLLDIDNENLPEFKDGEYETHISKGYSQGDVLTIIIPTKMLMSKLAIFKIDDEKKLIDHICWDSVLTCTFTINGEEYCSSYNGQYIDDVCNIGKNIGLDILNQLSHTDAITGVTLEVLVQEIEKVIPEYSDIPYI